MDIIKRGLEFLSISKRDLKWYQPKTEEQWVHEKVFGFLINHGQHEVVPVNSTKVLSRSEIFQDKACLMNGFCLHILRKWSLSSLCAYLPVWK